MKVIALTGRAGSGKDTAALILQLLTGAHIQNEEELNISSFIHNLEIARSPFDILNPQGGAALHKFAYPVYKIVAAMLGGHVSAYDLMNSDFKKSMTPFGFTGRELLQKVSTECFRDVIGESVWCTTLKNTLCFEKSPIIVVSDLRFLNEAQFLRSTYDTFIIRLAGRSSGVPETHPSESETGKIAADVTIGNLGSHFDLCYTLKDICKTLHVLNSKYTFK